KAAITEAMRVVADANKYLSETAPWQLRESDPVRMGTILHTALQAVDDCKSLLTPFLPNSSQKVFELLGGTGVWSGMPELREVDGGGGRSSRVLTGDYRPRARWESTPTAPGRRLAPPTPVFAKLDGSIVDSELARLGQPA